MVRSSARPTYSAWPLPRSASSTSSGAAALAAPMATEPSKVRDGAAERLDQVAAGVERLAGHEGRDHLGVGRDRRSGCAELGPGLQVGVVVDVAVERGDHVRRRRSAPSSSLLTGWALGSEMMPTLAHRVWPSTDEPRARRRQRQVQQAVAADRGTQRGGVVAELADLGRRLVDERQHAVGAPGPTPDGNSGSSLRRASRLASSGSSRSSPWSHTKRCSPAESRPRTSRRSMADSASWTARKPASAAVARVPPGQRRHGGRGAQAVAAHGPQRRPAADERGVGRSTSSRVGVGASSTRASSRGHERRRAGRAGPRWRRPGDGRSASARTPGTPRSSAVGHGGRGRPSGRAPAARRAPPSVERVRPRRPAPRGARSALGVATRPGRVRMATIPHMGGRRLTSVGRGVRQRRRPARVATRSASSWVGRLDHHPHERLGAARPHQHPPGGPELGLGRRHLGRQRTPRRPPPTPPPAR